jgi:FMN phosphatase YigB (HAD superfamily)
MTTYLYKPTLTESQINILTELVHKRVGEIFVETTKNLHGFFEDTKDLEETLKALQAGNCEMVLMSNSNFDNKE